MTQRVHIELSRVQTWLFAVPRLRAMVGANVLLGESLRVALPKLARETGRGWALAPCKDSEHYPVAIPDDPLKEHDDPAADARDGILSRDGGHFEAIFSSGAHAFAKEAGQLLRALLPGLPFNTSIDQHRPLKSQVHLSTELPVLAPCAWTGRGLASALIEQGDAPPTTVSLDVEERHKAAKRAEKAAKRVDKAAKRSEAFDIASLLSDKTKLKQLTSAQELKTLVDDGYLALIHADGNGVGSGLGTKCSDPERAEFYHRNRVLLRCALQAAIDQHCPDQGQAPLVPLMLGGDDLLLVARAELALPFVVTLCKELEALQKGRTDFKLTLGIGVVIAKYLIPIHRLHEVAEQLVSSAKRRYRGFAESDQKRSVVDWAVYSTSWLGDPVELRRRDWLHASDDDLRVLSQRPVDVLGEGLGTLEGLVASAERIEASPRSQIRYLVEQLSCGRALSELAWSELTQEARGPLREAGVRALWRRTPNNGPWLTELLDLVELAEIPRLGRRFEHTGDKQEAEHG